MSKCYVGTYKKYNEGILAGKWLNLSDYPTYQEFLQACKDLHKNEDDPEFMIQDWEDLPDGFPSVEWINEQAFNDIKAAMQDDEKASTQIIDYSDKAFAVVGETKTIKDDLKRLGGRFNPKLSCGAGWIFSKTKLEDVQKFLDCGAVATNDHTDTKRDEALWEEFRKRVLKAEDNSQDWLNYWLKGTSELMMTDCGVILRFEKEKIKVDFCWHDEGPDYEEYKRLHSDDEAMREYFINANLRKYDEQIEGLTSRKNRWEEPQVIVLYERDTCSHGKCGWGTGFRMMSKCQFQQEQNDSRCTVHQLTENDIVKALALVKSERAKMEKRLQTYLKRYGISKLHTWTYWENA